MKKIVFLFCFVFISQFLGSQNYKKLQLEAERQFNLNEFEKALQLSQQALAAGLADKKIDADNLIKLKTDNALYLVFNNDEAGGLGILNAITDTMDSIPPKPSTQIYVRKDFGTLFKNMGQYADALPHFKKAYDLCKTTSYNKKDEAAIIIALAECNQYLYRFTESETLFLEAILFCEKENLNTEIEYPTAFSGIALLYVDMLYEKKALENFEKAETIFLKNKDTLDPQFAIFLMDYATLLTDIYRYNDALCLLMRSKNLQLKQYTENSAEYAGVLNNIGYTYARLNKLTETEQYYTQAIEIKKNAKSVPFSSYLTSVNNLLFFYTSVGRDFEAEELIQELEKGLSNSKLQDTLKRMTFAQNLANYYVQHKGYIKAEKYYKDALLYSKTIYGDNNIEMGTLFISMSYLLWEQKKRDEAITYLNKVSEVLNSNLKVNVEQAVSLIINLTGTLKAFHLNDQAQLLVNESLKLIEDKVIISKSDISIIYLQKAEISAELDQVNIAIDYFNKYLDLKFNELESNFSYMTEAEKLQFLENLEDAVKSFYTVISNHIDKHPELIQILINFRLKTKGILLNNLSKIKKNIAQLNNPDLNKKYAQLKLDRENISKLMSFNTDEYSSALSEVAILKKEADQSEKEISSIISQSKLTIDETITWQTIQKQLKPDECAVEIIRTNLIYINDSAGTNYTYIVIKNTGIPIHYMIDRPLNWEEEVLARYRKSINDKKDDPDLYRIIWKGIGEKMNTLKTIHLSPDGIYNQINLNTLFNPQTNKYILEEKDIHLFTTLSDLIYATKNPSKTPASAVLIGNPSFNYDLSKLPLNKHNYENNLTVRGGYGFVLTELPGTKTEVETIKSQLDKKSIPTILLTEEKANEAEVKKIKNPDVLHIATHGFFLEDFPETSLAALTKTEQSYYRNPMMRSGIFFSGANNTYSLNTNNISQIKEFEDGVLTAFEAMNLDLDKTELVILSACQTGLGKVKNGEGVFGLQRALKLAGSKSIIMSLWDVSDEATMELMVSFYSKWLASGNIYNAFKEAQLDVKKKYPEPYYWGAFVLNGR